jgi:two-component system response regulator PilR (NtrC family)
MSLGRILVVDDEESLRDLLQDYFTMAGYEVVQASDGAEALKKFAPGKFDCIISDLAMPNIDGLELLKKIRLLDSEVVFLMITGYPEIGNAIEAMKEGAYDYVTKPFHMEDIQLKVERALNVRKTEMSLKKVKSLIMTLIILIPVLISLGIIFGIFWKGM